MDLKHLPSSRAKACGRQHSQLLEDLFAFATSWVYRKDAIPAGWTVELDQIKSMTFSDFRTHAHRGSRTQELLSRLTSMSVTLKALAVAVEGEVKALEVANRARGLASLPEEILSKIFNAAIQKEYDNALEKPTQWRTAVRLSHVNKFFRSIVLSNPRLWKYVYSSSETVTTCIPRSNGATLRVCLEIFQDEDDNGWLLEPLTTWILPFSHRWDSLCIAFNHCSFRIPKERLIKGHQLRCLDADLLDHLEINADSQIGVEWPHWDWPHWKTPNLRSLTSKFYFPSSLSGLSSLRRLNLTLRIDSPSIISILKKISEMGQLRDLTLSFAIADEIYDEAIVIHDTIVFPHVRSLKIELEQNLPDDNRSPALVRALFSSLQFPGAEELHVVLSGNMCLFDVNDGEWEEDWMKNRYFNKDVHRLFRNIDQFPNVDRFHLEVISPLGDYYHEDGWTELCIPLSMLPSVKHFTLGSNTRLDIKEPEKPDEIAFESERAVPPRVVGRELPVLQTVTLDMLDASVAAEWLEYYLGNLKDAGEVPGFRELVVMEKNEKYSRHKVSYPGAEALEWCTNA